MNENDIIELNETLLGLFFGRFEKKYYDEVVQLFHEKPFGISVVSGELVSLEDDIGEGIYSDYFEDSIQGVKPFSDKDCEDYEAEGCWTEDHDPIIYSVGKNKPDRYIANLIDMPIWQLHVYEKNGDVKVFDVWFYNKEKATIYK